MFGTDEHSKALLGQWTRAKELRNPDVVIKLASDKGLGMFPALKADPTIFCINRGGEIIFRGNLEDACKFVDDYNIFSVR